MSIFSAVLTMVAAQTSAPASLTPAQEYMFCVWDKSVAYSSTQEAAPTIVDAALANCSEKRLPAIQYEVAKAQQRGSPLPASDLTRIANETLDEIVKAKAIGIVVEKRAARANASN